jgi:hypothetical protein
MKPSLTPVQAQTLERIIADIDALYLDVFTDIETYQMAKLSTARGDLAFVLASTDRTPSETVKLVLLEGAVR